MPKFGDTTTKTWAYAARPWYVQALRFGCMMREYCNAFYRQQLRRAGVVCDDQIPQTNYKVIFRL